jgi:hypothetical protein
MTRYKELAGAKLPSVIVPGGKITMSKVLKQEPEFAAFVGIDWADQKHVWCSQAVD